MKEVMELETECGKITKLLLDGGYEVKEMEVKVFCPTRLLSDVQPHFNYKLTISKIDQLADRRFNA